MRLATEERLRGAAVGERCVGGLMRGVMRGGGEAHLGTGIVNGMAEKRACLNKWSSSESSSCLCHFHFATWQVVVYS